MGRAGITYNDVANAAQTLQTEGILPTIERVRTKLGTGSNGTITPHLRRWKSLANDTHQLASKEQLPEPLVELIKSLWQHMVMEAENQVSQIKKHSEETQSSLKQKFYGLEAQSQQWQQRYNQLQQDNEQTKRDKAALESGIVQLQQKESIAGVQLENSQKQLKEKQDRIDELNHLHKQVQSNLEHYRESSREQRHKELQQLEAKVNELKQSLITLENDLHNEKQSKSDLVGNFNDMSRRHEKLITEFDVLSNEHKTLENSATQDRNELTSHKTVNQRLEKSYQQLQAELKTQQKHCIELEKKLATTSHTLSLKTEQNKQLNAQVNLLNHEKWSIGQEKAKLEGRLSQVNIVDE